MAVATRNRPTTKAGYNQEAADRAVSFISALKHTKGEWAGKPFRLFPWQEKIIRDVFGTLKEDGFRQYNVVYIEVPKKNGKSELAAAVALFLLFADNEPGAEIYGAAADRDQAGIVFQVAAQMVRLSPSLSRRCKIIDSVKRIVVYKTGSFYRVLSHEVKSKHGFNTHGVIFDELHTQPNRELFDVLTKGSGDARRQPLFFLITTAGVDRNSICWEQHEKARQIINGASEDPTFYPVIYGPPSDDTDWDWTNEQNWYQVNPSLDEIITIDRVRTAYQEAQRNISEENTFKQLRLNLWVKQSVRAIKLSNWDACNGNLNLEELKGQACYSAFDLSSTTDLTALCHVFPQEGRFKALWRFWIPEESMRERIKRDHVPYDKWVSQGFVDVTPGRVVDYDYIQEQLLKDAELYSMRELAYDPYNATQFVTSLQKVGFRIDSKQQGNALLIQFRQGFLSLSPPTKELLKIILQGTLEHGGNPVARWNADNLVVATDPAGNLKPDKAKATQKIDGMVALIMALDRATRHSEDTGKSIYEKRGVLSL